MSQYEDVVRIDNCHVHLIYGLIVSSKPRSVLELGYGSGLTSNAVITALRYNCQDFDYVLVDNWLDYSYTIPNQVEQYVSPHATVITSSEKDYILSCSRRFDFIVSDADHDHSHEWFEIVYERILSPGGILVCHDVTNHNYPHLRLPFRYLERNGINHVVFNRSSHPSERCERGLLVIFKDT